MKEALISILRKKEYRQAIILLTLLLAVLIFARFSSNDVVITNTTDDKSASENVCDEAINESISDNTESESCCDLGTSNEDISEVSTSSINEDDLVPFNVDDKFSYCDQPVCRYNKDTDQIDLTIKFTSVPESDDFNIYIFEQPTYETDDYFVGKTPFAEGVKDNEVKISFPYKKHLLFSRFTPAILYEGEYLPLSLGQYITNPEDVAENTTEYPVIESKKGILLDAMTLDKKELTDLNVKRVVYNIPLSYIMGTTTNETHPTIDYDYLGITYQFNGFGLNAFDSLFKYLSDNDYHITVIILNDWNEYYPLLIHPQSRNRTGNSQYYAFNTTDESGVRIMEVAALFLAERYSGGDYGLVHDWIIANEVNQQRIWHYMASSDVEQFTDNLEKTFRTFYNAIKANYSNARVSFSIDHDWNDNGGNNSAFFNGKDIVTTFNRLAKSHGDYDWGLSIHPYPTPLTQTRFWKGYQSKSENAGVITPMNMTVLTDFMRQDEFLAPDGDVRDIGVTELGFSSYSGEKAQAAAFAYCYYIIKDNPYIDTFLMNRQTDSYLSLRTGLALGIYNPDYTAKYIKDVFADIDTPKGPKYIPEMLEIIGCDTMEEALNKAK